MASTTAKVLVLICGIVLIAYTGWLFATGAQVSTSPTRTLISLIGAIGIGLYRILMVVMPRVVPLNRRGLGLLGIAMVILAELVLTDSSEQYIFLQDIVKVLGVFLIIVGPMKLLVNKKVAEAKFNEKVEIIEV